MDEQWSDDIFFSGIERRKNVIYVIERIEKLKELKERNFFMFFVFIEVMAYSLLNVKQIKNILISPILPILNNKKLPFLGFHFFFNSRGFTSSPVFQYQYFESVSSSYLNDNCLTNAKNACADMFLSQLYKVLF